MKITKEQFRQIIKEELEKILSEQTRDYEYERTRYRSLPTSHEEERKRQVGPHDPGWKAPELRRANVRDLTKPTFGGGYEGEWTGAPVTPFSTPTLAKFTNPVLKSRDREEEADKETVIKDPESGKIFKVEALPKESENQFQKRIAQIFKNLQYPEGSEKKIDGA